MEVHNYKIGNNAVRISSPFPLFQFLDGLFENNSDLAKDHISINVLKGRQYNKILNGNNLDIYFQKFEPRDSFSIIPLIQCVLRMVSYTNIIQNKQPVLCHGSVCFYKNNGILFGDDDGNSTGKTFLSLELAMKSGTYCVDEYPLLKTNLEVEGFDIPIHIRKDMKNHYLDVHKIHLIGDFAHKDDIFIKPSSLFNFKKYGKIRYIIYPHFVSNSEGKFTELGPEDSINSFSYCVAAHIAKFIYPELDRFKSGSSTETIKIDDRIKKICNDIISKYNIDSYSRRICSQAKSFLVEYRNDNTVNVILDELF